MTNPATAYQKGGRLAWGRINKLCVCPQTDYGPSESAKDC